MSDMKFTPGPWRWDHNDLVSDAPGLNYGSRYVIELHEGTVYSEYSADGSTIDVTIPNAALIAAAPELYEALAAVTSAYQKRRDEWGLGDCAVLRHARAALLKASSEQSQ